MARARLDKVLVQRGLVGTRSQSESYIKLGVVKVDGSIITKPGYTVDEASTVEILANEQYVSRAGLKLASVAELLNINFQDKVVLDVGSSTGGFTDFALKHGAKKVLAVELGTDQLHPSLRDDTRIELHEKTDIRDFSTVEKIDIAVIDVSFVSLRDILPSVSRLASKETDIVAMVKPQFEAASQGLKHKGVIKNDSMRREILRQFETWAKSQFRIIDKADSAVSGAKGNRERFYLLRKV